MHVYAAIVQVVTDTVCEFFVSQIALNCRILLEAEHGVANFCKYK